jgi:iron complex outermembrane receptor protein
MARLWNRNGVGKSVFIAGVSFAACLAAASPAYGQTEAEQAAQASNEAADEADEDATIYVTATKRQTTLLEVPFSINAQTEEDIQRLGAGTIEDLSRNVAGLNVQNLGPGQSQISIRGVSAGQIIRDQPGVKEQVGVYLDESVISLSLFQPDLDLFDLNRVETLRGPQGTLFGSGSVGGTIRYITNQPNVDKMEGLVEGNVNLVDGDNIGGHLKGAINVPLGGKAAIRAVGYHTNYAGFIDARRPGGFIDEDVNHGRRTGGRIALLFQPTPDISITPRVVYQQVRANGFNRQEVYNLYANPFTTTRPAVTFGEREQFLLLAQGEDFKDNTLIADLTASADLGGVDLTSVTTYINRDILVSRDASALTGSVSVDLGFPTAGVLLPSNLVDTTDLRTVTQELRASSSGEGPFKPDLRAAAADPGLRRLHRRPLRRGHFGGRGQRLPAQLALQCRPALRHQAEGGVRRGELRHYRGADRDRGPALLRLQGESRLQVRRPLLERRQPDRPDRVRRFLAAAAAQLRGRR